MDTTRLAAQFCRQRLLVEVRTDENGDTFPVPAELSYNSGDPYALTVSFHVGDSAVPWTFARDLLSAGLTEPTGDGDVHVWPCLDDDGVAVVTLELCSATNQSALVEIRTRDAIDFIERTYSIVAPGMETAHLDVDAAISSIRAANA